MTGFIDYLKAITACSLVILSLMPSQPLASVILTDYLVVKGPPGVCLQW